MKFLLDANLPYSAKEVFASPHDAMHVRDLGLSAASDAVIIERAKKERAVLVTRDLDFANILRFPPRRYSGIVVLKIPSFYNAASIKRVLGEFLTKAKIESLPRSTVIVEEGRIRIRR